VTDPQGQRQDRPPLGSKAFSSCTRASRTASGSAPTRSATPSTVGSPARTRTSTGGVRRMRPLRHPLVSGPTRRQAVERRAARTPSTRSTTGADGNGDGCDIVNSTCHRSIPRRTRTPRALQRAQRSAEGSASASSRRPGAGRPPGGSRATTRWSCRHPEVMRRRPASSRRNVCSPARRGAGDHRADQGKPSLQRAAHPKSARQGRRSDLRGGVTVPRRLGGDDGRGASPCC